MYPEKAYLTVPSTVPHITQLSCPTGETCAVLLVTIIKLLAGRRREGKGDYHAQNVELIFMELHLSYVRTYVH